MYTSTSIDTDFNYCFLEADSSIDNSGEVSPGGYEIAPIEKDNNPTNLAQLALASKGNPAALAVGVLFVAGTWTIYYFQENPVFGDPRTWVYTQSDPTGNVPFNNPPNGFKPGGPSPGTTVKYYLIMQGIYDLINNINKGLNPNIPIQQPSDNTQYEIGPIQPVNF